MASLYVPTYYDGHIYARFRNRMANKQDSWYSCQRSMDILELERQRPPLQSLGSESWNTLVYGKEATRIYWWNVSKRIIQLQTQWNWATRQLSRRKRHGWLSIKTESDVFYGLPCRIRLFIPQLWKVRIHKQSKCTKREKEQRLFKRQSNRSHISMERKIMI